MRYIYGLVMNYLSNKANWKLVSTVDRCVRWL